MRLFRIETIVILILISGSAWAAKSDDVGDCSGPAKNIDDASKALYQFEIDLAKRKPPVDVKKLTKGSQEYLQYKILKEQATEARNDAFKLCGKSLSTGCDTAAKEYTDAFKKFSEACGEANITSGGAKCAQALKECDKPKSDDSEDDDTSDTDSKTSENAPLDVGAATREYRQCKPMAGVDLKKFESQLEDHKKEKRKLEKELPKLKEEAVKIQNDGEKKLRDLNREVSDLRDAHSKALVELQNKQADVDMATRQKIQEMQASITAMEDQLAQVPVEEMKAKIAKDQAKDREYIGCQNQVAAKLDIVQNAVVAQLNSGSYNRGGFTDLMKLVGLSDRARWQRVAAERIKWCMEDAHYTLAIKGINETYTLAVHDIKAREDAMKSKIATARKQMLQVDNGSPCFQTNTYQEKCVQAQKLATAYMQEQQSFGAKEADKQKEWAAEQYQTQRLLQAKNDEIKKAQDDVNNETTRLQNLQKFLQAKYDNGGTSNVDKSKVSKAIALMSIAKEAAKEVMNCAKEDADKRNKGDDGCLTFANCQSAHSFLADGFGESGPKTKGDIVTGTEDSPDSPPVTTNNVTPDNGNAPPAPTGDPKGAK